jgi:3,4-dihydroxy 2-butanone 4-phosphate synthase/GTP cyclohydrolase II
MTMQFIRVEEALKDLKEGKMIILTDNPDRENEGDLIYPAETITPEVVQFMIRHCSGIVCLSMTAPQLDKLNLPLMVPSDENTSQRGTPFTVSIEAREGVSTGVSAADRVTTILAAVKDGAKSEDLVRPGHVFPLRAKAGGVLERAGHTEGSVDLVRLAGFKPAAVLCEIMNPDGTMARGAQLGEFAEKHGLKILAIDELIQYRLRQEDLIENTVSTLLPLEAYGLFKLTIVKEKLNGKEHLVLSNDKPRSDKPPLVRVHSACMTGDLFEAIRLFFRAYQ